MPGEEEVVLGLTILTVIVFITGCVCLYIVVNTPWDDIAKKYGKGGRIAMVINAAISALIIAALVIAGCAKGGCYFFM